MKITVELDDTDIDELIAFILEYKKLKDTRFQKGLMSFLQRVSMELIMRCQRVIEIIQKHCLDQA